MASRSTRKNGYDRRVAILAAVDDFLFRSKIRATAKHVNADVQFAQTPEEILSKARELRPALFIIDLNLPRRSGRDVLEILRSLPACLALPVVVLSSSDAAQDRADAIRLGANEYLPKPSALDEFLSLGVIFKTMIDNSRS